MTGLIHEPLFTIETPVTIIPTALEIIENCIDDIRAGGWTTLDLETLDGKHCAIGLVGKNGGCYEPPGLFHNRPWIAYPHIYGTSAWSLTALHALAALHTTIPQKYMRWSEHQNPLAMVYGYNDHLGHVLFGRRQALNWFLRAKKALESNGSPNQ